MINTYEHDILARADVLKGKAYYSSERSENGDLYYVVNYKGVTVWFQSGSTSKHRLSGPAVITGYQQEWWYHGEYAQGVNNLQEFNQWIKLKAFM